MTNVVLQNNFTHGEMDPRLITNVQNDFYYKAALKIRNAYVRAQGGVRRRHGTIYQATVTSAAGDYKMYPFILSNGVSYLLVFSNLTLDIYRETSEDALTAVHSMVSPYTTAQLSSIQVTQNGNFMVITQQSVYPYSLVNGGNDTTWTLAKISFQNMPAFDFKKNYYSDTFKLSAVAVATSATLTWNGGSFSTDYEGGLFIALGASNDSPIGLARLRTYASATTFTVDVLIAFDSSLTSNFPGSQCFLGEPAWAESTMSAGAIARGYPSACAFYEDRLIVGGTPALPQTIFASNIGNFTNFDQGQGLDDQAIVYTLSSGQYNEIRHIVSDKSLQIFCSDSEFSSMQYFAEPLTPSSISIRKQSSNGSTTTQPIILDNQTFYVRKGGQAIMAFVFDPGSTSYTSQPVSILSAHLINNPVSGAVLKGDDVDDDDYMFLVNEDGSLLCYQAIASENISAWSLALTGPDITDPASDVPTNGKFKAIANVNDDVYVIVERMIDGSSVEYIEKMSFTARTDSAIRKTYVTPTTTITGLSTLNNETVRVIADAIVLDEYVVEGGQIELPSSATTVEVGLNYNVLVRPNPVNLVGQNTLYMVKRIVHAWVTYYESLGIYVNETLIPDLEFNVVLTDPATPTPPKTGTYEALLEGWSNLDLVAQEPTIDILQTDPLPFLVLGVGYEVGT